VSAAVSLAPEPEIERVRFSRLKLFAKSAAHYLENDRRDTSALDKGTGVHSLLLKGQRVTYYVRPPSEYELAIAANRDVLVYEAQRRGKEWEAFKADHPDALILSPSELEKAKAAIGSERTPPRSGAAWEKFQADNAGALILSQSEYDQTMRMVESVRSNAFAMELLKGKIEDTIEFDFLGIASRTTPDARTPLTVTELKTCRSSEPYAFAWQMKKLFYHAQMAFHVEGMCSLNSKLNPTPYIVAVESSPPYPVTVFRVTPAAMLEGHKLIRLWFEQLKVCTAANVWPAYSQAVVDLDVPGMDQDVGVIFGDETTDAA
jgi:hypothetical protein